MRRGHEVQGILGALQNEQDGPVRRDVGSHRREHVPVVAVGLLLDTTPVRELPLDAGVFGHRHGVAQRPHAATDELVTERPQ